MTDTSLSVTTTFRRWKNEAAPSIPVVSA